MAATVTVRAKLTSKIGFYIGDVCYEMTDEDYYADWKTSRANTNCEDISSQSAEQHTVTVNTKTSTDIATEWTRER